MGTFPELFTMRCMPLDNMGIHAVVTSVFNPLHYGACRNLAIRAKGLKISLFLADTKKVGWGLD
ncbi:MAG: hypothetical protein AAF465_15005 [Pseudomonadota bacterium]